MGRTRPDGVRGGLGGNPPEAEGWGGFKTVRMSIEMASWLLWDEFNSLAEYGGIWIVSPNCWQSAQVGQIRTREDYYYEELRGSSLMVLL